MSQHDFRPGDVVALKFDLKHLIGTRPPLKRGSLAVVTYVFPSGLLAINPVGLDENTDRVVRPGACELYERPDDIRCDWNTLAALKRLDPTIDIDSLRQSPVFPPHEVGSLAPPQINRAWRDSPVNDETPDGV